MEPGTRQQRPRKKAKPLYCSCTFRIVVINTPFKYTQQAVHSEMGGGTMRRNDIILTENQHFAKIPCFLLPTLCFSLLQQIFIVEASVRNPEGETAIA